MLGLAVACGKDDPQHQHRHAGVRDIGANHAGISTKDLHADLDIHRHCQKRAEAETDIDRLADAEQHQTYRADSGDSKRQGNLFQKLIARSILPAQSHAEAVEKHYQHRDRQMQVVVEIDRNRNLRLVEQRHEDRPARADKHYRRRGKDHR